MILLKSASFLFNTISTIMAAIVLVHPHQPSTAWILTVVLLCNGAMYHALLRD